MGLTFPSCSTPNWSSSRALYPPDTTTSSIPDHVRGSSHPSPAVALAMAMQTRRRRLPLLPLPRAGAAPVSVRALPCPRARAGAVRRRAASVVTASPAAEVLRLRCILVATWRGPCSQGATRTRATRSSMRALAGVARHPTPFGRVAGCSVCSRCSGPAGLMWVKWIARVSGAIKMHPCERIARERRGCAHTRRARRAPATLRSSPPPTHPPPTPHL